MELGKVMSAACAAIAVTMAARRSAADGGGRLLVFLHVAVKQRALQSILQDALSGVAVTTVGRIGDLDRALKDGQDAVLSLPVVLGANGLAPRLQGLRAGAADETYSLVAVNSPPDPSAVKAVGALDVLGRDGTTELVHGLLGARPKVERVTKVEDLLPLLQMDLVQAILMASRFLPEVRATSQLNLAATELGTRLGLPAVASVGPGGDSVIAAIRRMPANASKILGVDAWR
jgi:hypothetical protein